jgi:putative DNA primase/helicase
VGIAEMLQILGIRDYTTAEGEVKKRDAFFQNNWRAPSVADLFKNLDAHLAKIPEDARWNLYYTAANCGDGKREFKEQHVFAFDIDGIDVNRARDYVSIICATLGVKPEETGTVMTGHGLQLLIGLKNPITRAAWFRETKPHYVLVLRKITEALKAHGLKCDADASVYDHRRLLRLPGTINDKSYKGLPRTRAELLQANIVPVEFDIGALAGAPAETPEHTVPADFMKRYPKVDTPAVLAGCEFLKWTKDNAAKVNEPQWYAALSVLSRCENGPVLCHDYSKTHPGYTAQETQLKIDQALNASGPRTCKGIGTMWDGCKDCPNFGKVTSPIMLRGADYIRTESTGFRHVTFGEGGKVTIGKPCFEDLLKAFERKHRFVTMAASRIVYTWTGTHYQVTHRNEIEAFAQEQVSPSPTMSNRKEFADLVTCSNIVSPDWFAESTWRKMNFLNGWLDLTTMTFNPPSDRLGFRHVLPYNYEPTATCPHYLSLMNNVTGGDSQLQSILNEYAGYALSNDKIWLQKALVLLGEGSNGKSTWLNILKALVGEGNYSSLGLKDFESEYCRQMLDGKLFNVAEEMPRQRLETANFKAISTGGTVQARKPYQEPYSFTNRAKMLFACNTLPETQDTSGGFFRRFLIVPFNQEFSEARGNLDPFIEDKVLEELPGVLNTVLSAYRALILKKRFTESELTKEALSSYQDAQDTVLSWWNEYVSVNTNGGMETQASRIGDMYDSYVRITKANGQAPVNNKWFGRQLSSLLPNYRRHYSEMWDKQMRMKIRILKGVTFVDAAALASGARPAFKLEECTPLPEMSLAIPM